jgi:hypothetical protein
MMGWGGDTVLKSFTVFAPGKGEVQPVKNQEIPEEAVEL